MAVDELVAPVVVEIGQQRRRARHRRMQIAVDGAGVGKFHGRALSGRESSGAASIHHRHWRPSAAAACGATRLLRATRDARLRTRAVALRGRELRSHLQDDGCNKCRSTHGEIVPPPPRSAGVIALGPTIAASQEIDILMALPAATLTFSAPFLAEDAGFYKKEGLKVSHRTVVGVGAVNAVIAGSADFTMGTGPVFLRAAAQGQRLFAIANLIDKPLVELVLRKDVAAGGGHHRGRRRSTPAPRRCAARPSASRAWAASCTPGSAWSPAAAGSTSSRTSASRRWIRPACWRRCRPRRSTATPPRCRTPPRRWSRATPSCWRAP